MNVVVIRGRLTRNPDTRKTQEGKNVTQFDVAVDRPDRKTTDFIPVVTWEKLADSCRDYLVKGQEVCVQGRLQFRSYDGRDGQKKTVAEIIAREVDFGSKPNRADPAHEPITDAGQFGHDVNPDDEIPF